MKKIGLLLLALTMLAACSSEEKNLKIQGKVQGLKKGTLYLQKVEDTSLVTIDSVVMKGNETFAFETFIESPQVLYLYLNKKDNNIYDDRILFFAEPGEMTINTTLKNFEDDVVVEGSENQKKLLEYRKMVNRFNTRNLELIQQSVKARQEENLASLDSANAEYDRLLRRRYLFTVNFAINNKNLEIAPYLAMSEVFDANIKYLDTIYSSLTPKVKESQYGKNLKEFLKERRENEKVQEEANSQS
ncbi:DUF4369 domain-containing protein [Salinimicrobium sediminilitoris]|uniref:DUF4369 domain-containing protein n=1 Tax=Salinimicrobium sediminilitoris TaxID=2876715 RepID=UPI001E3F27BF|nr:DUF4369 domain-containing protein [Salinimicrobium sediminilitoris]MCC8360534.1 DUF4369 domain-containing protein [Salinimicrobium sediminilitoris]